jgi:alpha-beta hydrolase superfamily lysophospholipase
VRALRARGHLMRSPGASGGICSGILRERLSCETEKDRRVKGLAVAEATIPGLSPSPPLFGSTQSNDRLWHFAFNRLAEVNEQLVTGREHLYFGHQFATKAARKLPGYVVEYYVDALASDPEALRASFAFYRALDTTIAQNQHRKTGRLTLPVLAIAGADSSGELVANSGISRPTRAARSAREHHRPAREDSRAASADRAHSQFDDDEIAAVRARMRCRTPPPVPCPLHRRPCRW